MTNLSAQSEQIQNLSDLLIYFLATGNWTPEEREKKYSTYLELLILIIDSKEEGA